MIVVAEVSKVSRDGEPRCRAAWFAATDASELHALYVLPEYWRRGVGERLLEPPGPVRELWVLQDNLRALLLQETRLAARRARASPRRRLRVALPPHAAVVTAEGANGSAVHVRSLDQDEPLLRVSRASARSGRSG